MLGPAIEPSPVRVPSGAKVDFTVVVINRGSRPATRTLDPRWLHLLISAVDAAGHPVDVAGAEPGGVLSMGPSS